MKNAIKAALVYMMLGIPMLHATQAEGLPLPWPFPWAKECPMEWTSMNGTYALTSSNDDNEIYIRIKVTPKKTLRLVRVSRLSDSGKVLYSGSTYISEVQRIISLELKPTTGSAGSVWAEIKMHYDSKVCNCNADRLVPIMSIKDPDPSHSGEIQYRMWKLENR